MICSRSTVPSRASCWQSLAHLAATFVFVFVIVQAQSTKSTFYSLPAPPQQQPNRGLRLEKSELSLDDGARNQAEQTPPAWTEWPIRARPDTNDVSNRDELAGRPAGRMQAAGSLPERTSVGGELAIGADHDNTNGARQHLSTSSSSGRPAEAFASAHTRILGRDSSETSKMKRSRVRMDTTITRTSDEDDDDADASKEMRFDEREANPDRMDGPTGGEYKVASLFLDLLMADSEKDAARAAQCCRPSDA
jgi:hypothetical protein